MKRVLVVVVAIAVVSSMLAGCDLFRQTASFTVKLTDAPVDAASVESVTVSFTGVQLIFSEDEADDSASWVFDPPRAVELLNLVNGDTTTLLEGVTLPAGTFSQIRFMVDLQETGQGAPTTPASYVTVDGVDTALFVPSGGHSGYKAVFGGAVDVPANGAVTFVVDWDVRKALVEAGDRYILKPTFRVVVEDEAGRIAGNITNPGTEPLIVFAYESGTYDESEAATPAGEASWFPGAVSSDLVEDDGTGEYCFQIWYLAAGEYDFVVASFDEVSDTYSILASPIAGAANFLADLVGIIVTPGDLTEGIALTL